MVNKEAFDRHQPFYCSATITANDMLPWNVCGLFFNTNYSLTNIRRLHERCKP